MRRAFGSLMRGFLLLGLFVHADRHYHVGAFLQAGKLFGSLTDGRVEDVPRRNRQTAGLKTVSAVCAYFVCWFTA